LAYGFTDRDIELIQQKRRVVYVTIELLNREFKAIDRLEGELLSDNYSISADSDIRRTYNLALLVKDSSFLVDSGSKIWVDKYIRVSIGLHDLQSDEIVWYLRGIYVFDTAGYAYDPATKNLTLSCLDRVAELNGTVNGQLSGLSTQIQTEIVNRRIQTWGGAKEHLTWGEALKYTWGDITDYIKNTIRSAMLKAVTQLGEVNRIRIEPITGEILTEDGFVISENIPYDLEFATGATIWDIVKELRDLYPGWECFFDGKYFVCQPTPTVDSDPIIFDAQTLSTLVSGEDTSVELSKVRNVVEIWGQCLEADYYTENPDMTHWRTWGSALNLTWGDGLALQWGNPLGKKMNVSYEDNVYHLRYEGLQDVLKGAMFAFKATHTTTESGTKIQIYRDEDGELIPVFEFPLDIITGEYVNNPNDLIHEGRIREGKSYVVKYLSNRNGEAFYFMGEFQIAAIAKLVSKDPDVLPSKDPEMTLRQYDFHVWEDASGNLRANEPTTNISYIIDPDSPFCLDYIGERRLLLSGGEYDNIYSEILAMKRAQYENWLHTDLLDNIILDMIDIPFMDVHQKIEHESQLTGETSIYLTKSISGSSIEGKMSLSCIKFKPLYPWVSDLPESDCWLPLLPILPVEEGEKESDWEPVEYECGGRIQKFEYQGSSAMSFVEVEGFDIRSIQEYWDDIVYNSQYSTIASGTTLSLSISALSGKGVVAVVSTRSATTFTPDWTIVSSIGPFSTSNQFLYVLQKTAQSNIETITVT